MGSSERIMTKNDRIRIIAARCPYHCEAWLTLKPQNCDMPLLCPSCERGVLTIDSSIGLVWRPLYFLPDGKYEYAERMQALGHLVAAREWMFGEEDMVIDVRSKEGKDVK